MSDIGGAPPPTLILAKLDLQIDQQRLALEQKDLRLLELAEEEGRVKADIERVEALRVAAEAERVTITDAGSIDARRLGVKAHELVLQVKTKKIRLLELDGERESIASDKAAATEHITKLGAEVAQQQQRLKEPPHG